MSYDRQPSAPVMNRSRSQLASAYAPGAFFTFEGGRGACIALPDDNPAAAQIAETAKTQIRAQAKRDCAQLVRARLQLST